MKVWSLGLVSKHWYTVFSHFCHLFTCCHFYYRIIKSPFTIHITCILPSLRRTSAPIQLTIVLGVLGTQETSCILTAGLLERNIFDLYLPEFDIPWVVHLRETCCCSTNLCTWGPNTVCKSRSIRRHQALFWRRCRGGERLRVSPLDPAVIFLFLVFILLVRLNGKQQKN